MTGSFGNAGAPKKRAQRIQSKLWEREVKLVLLCHRAPMDVWWHHGSLKREPNTFVAGGKRATNTGPIYSAGNNIAESE
jgi:hypothetical protein